MAGFTAAGITFDTVTNESSAGADDASQLAPLGFELTRMSPVADEGLQTWVYVKANGALNTEGVVVGRGDSVSTYRDVIPAALNTPCSAVVGVVVHTTIGDNGYGFILKKGVCNVLAGAGTIDDNEGIMVEDAAGDAGKAQATGSAAEDCFGVAFADADDDALAKCYINCRG